MRLVVAPLLAAGALTAQAGTLTAQASAWSAGTAAWHTGHHRVYVAHRARAHGADRSCATAAFRSIQSAVRAVRPGGSVVVCRGVYHQQVLLWKPVRLLGGHRAVIDERHVRPWVQAPVPGFGKQAIYAAVVIVASGVTVQGFKIRGAKGEGILAVGVRHALSHLLIWNNAVVHNDLGGGIPPRSHYFECRPFGQIPGDCGEGVHFLHVAHSVIRHNLIGYNAGGVLFTDETGPTHDNLIASNLITHNASDCGVTLPGHNPHALSGSGRRQPRVAGVYRNVIRHNLISYNGLTGDGAGVLFANATAGTASYDNLVTGNLIYGNGLAGVTMHAHTVAPGGHEDLSGNNVIGNSIGTNNIDGDPLDAPASPQDLQTTAVVVFSGGVPVHVTIAHNKLYRNAFGVWLSAPVHARGLHTNRFRDVQTPISGGH